MTFYHVTVSVTVTVLLKVVGTDGYPLVGYSDGFDMYVAHCTDAVCATAPSVTHVVTDFGNKIAHSPSIGIGPGGLPVLGWQESQNLFAIGECSNLACTTITRRVIDWGGEADGYGGSFAVLFSHSKMLSGCYRIAWLPLVHSAAGGRLHGDARRCYQGLTYLGLEAQHMRDAEHALQLSTLLTIQTI
jgi:hypothetical protein